MAVSIIASPSLWGCLHNLSPFYMGSALGPLIFGDVHVGIVEMLSGLTK